MPRVWCSIPALPMDEEVNQRVGRGNNDGIVYGADIEASEGNECRKEEDSTSKPDFSPINV